jgi:hypothetical protein
MRNAGLLVLALFAAAIGSNIGSFGDKDIGSYQSASSGAGCDSNLHWLDTTKTWADAIAAKCTLLCDTGKIVFQWATDTAGTISRDSVTAKKTPYAYTDTTGTLTPSTAYFLRFVFDSDTSASAADTTLWYSRDTRDSSDTSDYWLYEAPAPRVPLDNPRSIWEQFKQAAYKAGKYAHKIFAR